jgi:hypothetical protein
MKRRGDLPVEPSMRELVHAPLPRLRRMALPHRDQHEGRFLGLLVTGEDCSPLAGGLRDVELHATPELRSIMTFGFAAQEPLAGSATVAQRRHHRLDRRPRCWRAASEVLRQHLIDHPDFKARTRARAHERLSLAVGGQRPEVPIEILGTHRRGPGPLADLLDRSHLGRPVGRIDQLRLGRFLIGHRLDLLDQLSLGHGQIVPPASPESGRRT